MKHLIAAILCATTNISANAQSLNFDFKEGKQCVEWKNNLPTKEIDNISHSTNADGQGIIDIKMKSGPTYTYCTDTIAKAVNTHGEDLSMYKNGDLLCITNDEDWSDDTLFIDHVYHGTGVYSYFNTVMKLKNEVLKRSRSLLNPYVLHYHIYDIDYVSTDVDGQKIRMSGRVVYPYNVKDVNNKPLTLSNIFLESHCTTLAADQAPTHAFDNQYLTGMICNGYLAIQPDLMGLGATQTRSQLFIDQETMSRNVVDCILATMQLKDKVSNDPNLIDIPLEDDATIISEGISQGASVGVGVHRYIENNLTEEETARMPKIKETRVCSGCYDSFFTLETYAKWDSINFCSMVPVMMQGVVIAHPDLMVDDNGKSITVNDLFSEKFNTDRHPLYDNLTTFEMINSKKYEGWTVTYSIWDSFGTRGTIGDNKTGKAKFAAFLNPELVIGDQLNYDHPYIKALKNALELSNNTHGWCPKAKLSIWYGEHDNVVPYQNATNLYDNLKAEYPDANVEINKVEDEALGTHSLIGGAWMLSELLGMDVNLVVKIMTQLLN